MTLNDRLRGCAVGIAGCGEMGAPMARRLLAAGHDTRGFDVRPAADFGDLSPYMVGDPAAFAAICPVVFSVVRDARQTFDLCFDVQGLCIGERRPELLVLCSTLPPRVVHEVRTRLDPDIALVDAPMSGAPVGAEQGTLTFMVGGDDDAAGLLEPMLRAMGREVHDCGALGAGMTVKVLNNYVAVASVVAVRRVLDAAPALGIEPARLRQIMRSSSGRTWFGDGFDTISWSRQGYDPGNTIGILEKDLAAARDALSPCATPDDVEALDQAFADALRRLRRFVADS